MHKNAEKKEVLLFVTRQIKKMVATGEKSEAEKLLPKAYALSDKMVKNGILKKNTAARIKSRMTLSVAKK